jgi:hypothetical protein
MIRDELPKNERLLSFMRPGCPTLISRNFESNPAVSEYGG